MKVFVTGGTGAVGRFVLPELVGAGHEVVALARSGEKAAAVSAYGAKPAQVSLFDADALARAFDGCDAVCNLATSIPPMNKAMRASAWATNERIRIEGSAAVVDAALAAGVGRIVQESITFTYPDRGDEWIDESVPIQLPALGYGVGAAEANLQRFRDNGATGVVLRFGLFYGPRSDSSDLTLSYARRHLGFVAGSGTSFQSSIHLEDAGRAVAAALTVPAGTYNVCDDEPVTKQDYAAAVGAAVGKRPWLLVPGRWVALAGTKTDIMRRSQRVSNGAFRSATDWTPRYPSVGDGWPAVVAAERQGAIQHA